VYPVVFLIRFNSAAVILQFNINIQSKVKV